MNFDYFANLIVLETVTSFFCASCITLDMRITEVATTQGYWEV